MRLGSICRAFRGLLNGLDKLFLRWFKIITEVLYDQTVYSFVSFLMVFYFFDSVDHRACFISDLSIKRKTISTYNVPNEKTIKYL